jgi:undecaprenyl-diphosphatase
VTELFPVSSLGHSVLVPAWIGGSWAHLVTEGASGSSSSSPYLAFVVALHVATAVALLVFYARDWVAIVRALLTTLRTRRVRTSTERLAWLLVAATVPVGVLGLLFEHPLRRLFATPLAAAVFLTLNGLLLLLGERLRRRSAARAAGAQAAPDGTTATRTRTVALADLSLRDALVVGVVQSAALLAGISRSGVTMVAGLVRGLDHEDAARFSFLLATPVILAAGLLKLPTLAGPAGAGIGGQTLVGALTAGVAAYVAVRFLTRWFTTRTLTPFAVYCLLAGGASVLRFA